MRGRISSSCPRGSSRAVWDSSSRFGTGRSRWCVRSVVSRPPSATSTPIRRATASPSSSTRRPRSPTRSCAPSTGTRRMEIRGGSSERVRCERTIRGRHRRRGTSRCTPPRPKPGAPHEDGYASFDRIRGEHGITASNIAKYDGYHGVLVFDEHDPLAPMDAEVIRDRLLTARRWALAANEEDPSSKYYFLIWNCLWRAGGSIVHGHMQMTTTRGMHYPRVEMLRRRALEYDEQYGHDYFDDLWLIHDALGLGHERDGARVFAALAPIKESEVIILGRPGEDETSLAAGIAGVISAYRKQGVVAYN